MFGTAQNPLATAEKIALWKLVQLVGDALRISEVSEGARASISELGAAGGTIQECGCTPSNGSTTKVPKG
jgi:hypothetical protein